MLISQMRELDNTTINAALELLGKLLENRELGPYRIAVCGGAALIGNALVSRTTQDVDVVALINEASELVSPDPLPSDLLHAAEQVQREYDLPDNWLNNGPSREPGGLFQTGLPDGFSGRLIRRDYGNRLTVFFASRIDLINFKVFAAVDQGYGRHVDDLLTMRPTMGEITAAAEWATTHDSSVGFRTMLRSMLKQLGFDDAAERIQ